MVAGQAAFDNVYDEDSSMNIDNDVNDYVNSNNKDIKMHSGRPSRTIEYYFSPKVSHK